MKFNVALFGELIMLDFTSFDVISKESCAIGSYVYKLQNLIKTF